MSQHNNAIGLKHHPQDILIGHRWKRGADLH